MTIKSTSSFPWLEEYLLSNAKISSDFLLQNQGIRSQMEGRGQHQTLSIDWNIAYQPPDKTLPQALVTKSNNRGDIQWALELFDVLLLFRLPSGVFVDPYELQGRFALSWNNQISLYSYRDYIPYEDINYWQDNNKRDVAEKIFGIELQNMPCKHMPTLEPSSAYCHLEYTLDLPIHLQYYQAQSTGGYILQNVSFPEIYLRPRKVLSKDQLPQPSFHKHAQVTYYYEKTYLGHDGNLNNTTMLEKFPVKLAGSKEQVSLRVPLGNLDHTPLVTTANVVISTLCTILIMFSIFKVW